MTLPLSPSVLLLTVTLLFACGDPRSAAPPSEAVGRTEGDTKTPDAGPGAMAPNLAAFGDDVLLTWLEPDGGSGAGGHRLRISAFRDGRWTPPAEIAAGEGFFANWADLPGAAAIPGGGYVAHWLEKLGDGTYAYGVQLARADDVTGPWSPAGLLHTDASSQEHGFVSWLQDVEGLRGVWLDGRAMAGGGPMQLRTANVGADSIGPEEVLDAKVCECCSTDAAATADGALVVYRDRSDDELRDIYAVRATPNGWSAPVPVAADGWRIQGCPVNGPAVAADGRRVATAWFTGADDRSRVLLAFSDDAGATFGPPLEVDAQDPLGRVDVALDDGGDALVLWLASAPQGDGAEIRLARVRGDGVASSRAVAATTAARSAGVPKLARQGDRLWIAWVEDSEPSRLRVIESTIP
ncbi:MAG: hypothetical protein AAGN66_20885 [Acidobacteriota bacterium]